MGAMRVLLWMVVMAPALRAQAAPDVKGAITRALPLLQRSAAEFVAKRACVSCHHNILPILMLHMAQDRGVPVDAGGLKAIEEKTFRSLRGANALDEAIQGATLNDPTPNDSFLLMAGGAAGLPRDLVSGVYARRLIGWQREGHWVTSDFRPPHSSSEFTATATAARAIGLYAPEELGAERDACFRKARAWLAATRPVSTEDASFRLLGLVWAGAGPDEIDVARKDLAARQLAGGGWPQLAGYPADAYSTGEALFALHEARASGKAWARGLAFLIQTQAADGSWRLHTRMLSPARVSPPYFTTGFPYQKDEYVSYAASCWAVMALLSALPETAPPHAIPEEHSGEPWVRTALFGTPQQLSALLGGGLDPNHQTEAGTTVLMMAAPDAEKVRILLMRGADAKARARSGCDALTIAAAYRGTAAPLDELLHAGAEVQAPSGVHAPHSALLFASMTGDVENVRLLLAHGADASATPSPQASTPLAAAVTFGYADIVQVLIAAGASAKITESTGINLLHWAAIANRASVIPHLIKAGVPLNASDENGYTPLMYAATIDFGDSEVVRALVTAGADRQIRNDQGRTAREQAHSYRHRQIEAALR